MKSESEIKELKDLIAGAGLMHPADLVKIAINCGNGMWCRHWYHWAEMKDPWVMAIQIRSWSGSPVGIDGMEKEGFVRYDDCIYLIRRADGDGNPYKV